METYHRVATAEQNEDRGSSSDDSAQLPTKTRSERICEKLQAREFI